MSFTEYLNEGEKSTSDIDIYLQDGEEYLDALKSEVKSLEKLIKNDPIKNFKKINSSLDEIKSSCEYIHDNYHSAKYK